MAGFEPRLPAWDLRNGVVMDRRWMRAVLGRVWGFAWRYVCAVGLVTGWAYIEDSWGLLEITGSMRGPQVPISPGFNDTMLVLTSALEVLAILLALLVLRTIFTAAFAALGRRRR